MKILFLHGLESKPGGSKVKYLEDLGHTVFSPSLPKNDFEESVKIAQIAVNNDNPDVIVGSSRGGAIAMSIDTLGARLVLIAPAWQNFGSASNVPSGTSILHCTTDKIVPYAHSEKLSGSNLIPCGESHRMNDYSALEALGQAIENTLKTETLLREYISVCLVEKKWSDFNAPKGKIISITSSDFEAPESPPVRDLDDEIFDLIQNAYSDVPLDTGGFGNIKIQSPEDLPGGYTVMKGADIDGDAEPDYFRGGKMRNGRFKLGIVGHDGSQAAISKYLGDTADELKSGAIGEMSGKIAHLMITRYNVPAVTDKSSVEEMLGKSIEWVGRHPDDKYANRYGAGYEGWYKREISDGEAHIKILLGGA